MPEFVYGVSNGASLPEKVLSSRDVGIIEVKKSDVEAIRNLHQYDKRLLFHLQYDAAGNFLNPCSPDFQESVEGWLDDVVDAFEKASTEPLPWISIHFGWSCSHFKADPATFKGEPDTEATGYQRYGSLKEVLINFSHSAAFLHKRYGIPILAENLEYHPTGVYDHVTEPIAITTATYLEHINGTIFDSAHAYVAAHNLHNPPLKRHNVAALSNYLRKLPLETVKEIHVSGFGRTKDRFFTDSHNELSGETSEELELLKLVVSRLQEDWIPVILEYDRDPTQILNQLELVKEAEVFN